MLGLLLSSCTISDEQADTDAMPIDGAMEMGGTDSEANVPGQPSPGNTDTTTPSALPQQDMATDSSGVEQPSATDPAETEVAEAEQPSQTDAPTETDPGQPGSDEMPADSETRTDEPPAEMTDAEMMPEEPDADCVPDYDCDPEPPDTGDPYADCVARVNQFRACACLGPLDRNFEAEACMDEQAEYDSSRGAHAGFSDRICTPSGNSQNECPGWRDTQQVIEGCIRMMYYEGPPPTEDCTGQCYQDHGHFINMTDTRVTSVACGFYDADGELWSVQNFFR